MIIRIMKKWFYILALLLVVCVTTVPAQEYKWGFIDKTGKWVILPQFDYVEDFSEGLAAVEVGKKIGYVDTTGKMVISPQFKKRDVMSFHEGLAVVEIEEDNGYTKCGYIDYKGNVVIPLQFFKAWDFAEGLALVKISDQDGSYRFIDKKGNSVIQIQPQYKWISLFSEGKAALNIESERGYIDKTGRVIIPPQFIQAGPFKEGLACVSNYQVGGCGYIDSTGKWIIPEQFDFANDFSEGLAAVIFREWIDVERGNIEKSGFIDKTGKLVIPLIFDYAEDFHEGLAAVHVDDKWGYIDKSGRVVIRPSFDRACDFSEGLAAVKVNGKWGYVDQTGKMVITPRFDGEEWSFNAFHNGLAAEKVSIEQYRRDSLALSKANIMVQNTWKECNKQFVDYPYNIEKLQLEPVDMARYFMDPRLSTVADSIVTELKQKTKELQDSCYLRLKTDRPEMFAGIYMQQHPELKSVLENLKLECRCNNYSEAELVVRIADNNIPKCTCRSDYWNQYGNLFSSRTEFDNTYNTSEQGFLDDVNLRQSLRSDIQDINSMLAGLKTAKFKDGLAGKNENTIQILQKVQYHKGKPYYDEVVEMMFTADVAMEKEWEKNGSLFSSKNEFYEAYVSGDYKNVLKEKKSKH